MKNKLKTIFGLVASGAIGAAFGMLFAPHKGTVLRKNLRRKGEAIASDVAENIEDRAGKIRDTVTEKLDELKKDVKSRF